MLSPSLQAWPFLVGPGHTFGYHVVAAPQFLLDAAAESLLLRADGSRTFASPSVAVQAIRLSAEEATRFGDLVLISRDVAVAGAELGRPGGQLLDQHGRGIQVREGFVVRGQPQDRVDRDLAGWDMDRLFDQVHEHVMGSYANYFFRDEPADPVPEKPWDLPARRLAGTWATAGANMAGSPGARTGFTVPGWSNLPPKARLVILAAGASALLTALLVAAVIRALLGGAGPR